MTKGEDRGYRIKKEVVTQEDNEERVVDVKLDDETLKRVVRVWLSER
jgi:hypothetical protein